MLLDAAERARAADLEGTTLLVDTLRRIHANALSQLKGEQSAQASRAIERLFEELKVTLTGVSILKELTPRSRDLIVSFGERLSVVIVCSGLVSRGVNARGLTGGEAGIITDESYGEASPVMASTRKAVRKSLGPLLRSGVVPVVAGYIARSIQGEVTTLGRGGSDYTATILADALGADEVWIWTDVDGMMTADPKIVKDARVVKALSYAEAEEMATFGAKKMHPLALGPARLKGIPVRIKNGFRPDLPGTLVSSHEEKRVGAAKAIALVKKVGMLTVSGETLQGRPGTAGRVFEVLGHAGINVLMISQSVSESNISMVVGRNLLERARLALARALSSQGPRMDVLIDPDIAVLAAVGAGMKGTPGVAARLFGAVARKGINVKMIAQGSSELNISFVVRERDAEEGLRTLHSALVASR